MAEAGACGARLAVDLDVRLAGGVQVVVQAPVAQPLLLLLHEAPAAAPGEVHLRGGSGFSLYPKPGSGPQARTRGCALGLLGRTPSTLSGRPWEGLGK